MAKQVKKPAKVEQKIKTLQDLENKIAHCSECVSNKFNGKDGKRHIVVCGGTGCLSSDSQKIIDNFNALIKEKHLEDKVTCNVVGCFGFCSQGPFVKIYPEDTLYHAVKPTDCVKIIEEDIIGGKIVEELLYTEPSTGKKVTRQDDINFYKKQLRIALHGCGTINPEVIDEALGYDAFKGLIRALSMKREEVIEEILASGLRGRGGAAELASQLVENGNLLTMFKTIQNM